MSDALNYRGGLGAAAAAATARMPRAMARPPAMGGGMRGGGDGMGGVGVLGALGALGKPRKPGQEGPLSGVGDWIGRQLRPAEPSAYQAPGVVQAEPLADLPIAMLVEPGSYYPPGYAAGGLASAGPRRLRARRVGAAGLVHSASPGRADHVEGRLRRGSYVLPADVVSGLGEGNTLAGAKLLRASLPELAEMASAGAINRASGGLAEPDDEIEVRLSGGEYLVSPEQVLEIGEGDVERGASALDDLVHSVRGSTRQALGRMAPPK